jgi:hypothetical protein
MKSEGGHRRRGGAGVAASRAPCPDQDIRPGTAKLATPRAKLKNRPKADS